MAAELYLVRHAAVALPAGICYGRSDVPLLEPVEQHVRWLCASLPVDLPADVPIFSSPLSRCASLARAMAAQGAPVVFDARLVEMDFGDWEMQPFDAIPRDLIDAWAADPWGFRMPGGETGEGLMARVAEVVDEILARHARAVIVSHGGPMRGICGKLLGLPREAWLGQDVPLASVTIMRESAGQWLAEQLQCPGRVVRKGKRSRGRPDRFTFPELCSPG